MGGVGAILAERVLVGSTGGARALGEVRCNEQVIAMRGAWIKLLSMAAAMGAVVVLPNTGCTRELRQGVVSGATSFLSDATYGLLAELLPFPLGEGAGGTGGDDPFSDVPLQM